MAVQDTQRFVWSSRASLATLLQGEWAQTMASYHPSIPSGGYEQRSITKRQCGLSFIGHGTDDAVARLMPSFVDIELELGHCLSGQNGQRHLQRTRHPAHISLVISILK